MRGRDFKNAHRGDGMISQEVQRVNVEKVSAKQKAFCRVSQT